MKDLIKNIMGVFMMLMLIQARANVIYEIFPEGEGLQSLKGAKENIDSRLCSGENGEYIVALNDGVYFLEEPIVFNPENWKSTDYSITFTSKEGSQPVISGGESILSWKFEGHRSDIIKSNVNFVVRNLWVDDERMQRAQGFVGYAAGIFDETVDGEDMKGLLFKKEGFPEFKDISGLEIKYYKNWRCYYFKVKAIHDSTSLPIVPEDQILVVCKNFDVALTQTPQMNWIGTGQTNPYYFENALELLDEPGEWCYMPSENALYYCLKEGESPDNIEAVVPRLENLISVGSISPGNSVCNLGFQGIRFSHCDWPWPSYNGFVTFQSSVYYKGVGIRGNIPSAVSLEDAKSVIFESCIFQNFGTSGIHIKNNIDDACIRGCQFRDLSGAAVSISDPNHRVYSDSILPVKDIVIKNNLIEDIGVEYANCSAIEAFYAEDVTISHNELYNCPYTGISVGWGWNTNPTTTKNVKVINNKIIGDTKKCGDGGGIYSLSHFSGDGLLILGNYVDEISSKPVFSTEGAIYADQGSSNVLINNNVVLSDRKWFYCNQAGSVVVDTTYVMYENHNRYGGKGERITYVENGEHIFDFPDIIAESIIENAGIQNNDSDLSSVADMISRKDFLLSSSQGTITIDPYFDADNMAFKVCIYRIDGCMERVISSDFGRIFVDGLPKGIHIIEIETENQRWIYRLGL